MFLGHRMGVSNSYMKPSLYEMVNEYIKAIPSLTILSGSNEAMSRDSTKALFNERFLKMSKWTDEEIATLGDLSQIDEDKLQELIDNKNKERLGLRNGNSQKVVKQEGLESYINDGWEFVIDLDGDKAIVRLPANR